MKKIIFLVFTCSCLTSFAQDKPANSSSQKTTVNDSTSYPGKKKSSQPVSKKDTIRIAIPKDDHFDPSNAKLRNSKIKTPVYDNTLRGTNAPGDPNTGLPPSTTRHATTNDALDKVRATNDSINNNNKPN